MKSRASFPAPDRARGRHRTRARPGAYGEDWGVRVEQVAAVTEAATASSPPDSLSLDQVAA